MENEKSLEDEGRVVAATGYQAADKPAISLYDFAVRLKDKIQRYPGGGIKGVWDALDPRFKSIETPLEAKIKYPKSQNTIKEGAFRKQVQRLDNKKLIGGNMTFGVKGNILLLLNVLEILGIRSLIDLMGDSFEKPSAEEYAIDTNIRVKRMARRLNKLSAELKRSMERKPRFSIPKVCQDWLAILNEMKSLIEDPEGKRENKMNLENIINIINRPVWIDAFIKTLKTQSSQFAIRLNTIMSQYRAYFFNDALLQKYYERLSFLDMSKYSSPQNIFALSPLYALYFLILMNKRFFYYLDLYKKKEDGKRYEYISAAKITEQTSTMLEGKPLGEYIAGRFQSLLRILKRLLNVLAEARVSLDDQDFKKYLEICKNVFTSIFEMNLLSTNINPEWMDNTIARVKNLNELRNEMVLGRSNLFLPTDSHINTINENIQTLEKITESVERDSE